VLGDAATVSEALRRAIDEETAHYRRTAPARHPGFEVGLRWLLANVPERNDPPVVCHGDFRLNNTLWTAPGELGAVLDWERAWAGDPMCDIAFTRQFSGWAAIDSAVVAEYEAASGRRVREEEMTFFLRFERWRSYTASMRGLAALVDGRRNDPALAFIGEAGQRGMWEMVDWITDGLPPLPDELAERDPEYGEAMSPERRRSVAAAIGEGDPGRRHLLDDDADRKALHRSVSMLRTVRGLPDLSRALVETDPELAWHAAYRVVTRRAGDEGRRLHPA
ncbi:MAG: phosphotransferase, partial [Actinobacteria bacterium]|nr:phosphotransferase [Actinomycetota bacterium]NIU22914.1 phosphotransferase [Actinomycetota bacterium]NIU71918.1 phosphotransferase [Actinomycetota bacterium]NIW33860.1 phosphotransferase [Actinomycetota bacterium]